MELAKSARGTGNICDCQWHLLRCGLKAVECREEVQEACEQAQLRDQNDDFICELYQVDYVQALLLFTVIYYEVDGT